MTKSITIYKKKIANLNYLLDFSDILFGLKHDLNCIYDHSSRTRVSPLTAGTHYIRVLHFIISTLHITFQAC